MTKWLQIYFSRKWLLDHLVPIRTFYASHYLREKSTVWSYWAYLGYLNSPGMMNAQLWYKVRWLYHSGWRLQRDKDIDVNLGVISLLIRTFIKTRIRRFFEVVLDSNRNCVADWSGRFFTLTVCVINCRRVWLVRGIIHLEELQRIS